MKRDVVGRPEVQELLKLVEHIKVRANKGIEQGRGTRKQAIRIKLMSGAYALKVALEEIEREVDNA